MLEDVMNESKELYQLIERMLSFDPVNLPTLEELKSLKVDHEKKVGPNIANLEESKVDKSHNQNQNKSDSSLQSAIKTMFEKK